LSGFVRIDTVGTIHVPANAELNNGGWLFAEQGTTEKAHARTEWAQNRLGPKGPGAKCRALDRHFRDRRSLTSGFFAGIHLPVEIYATLLASLDGIRDRVIFFFLIACLSSLQPEGIRPDSGSLDRQCVYYREYRVA